MQTYGFEILGFWESPGDDGPRFVYLLQWPDEAAMRTAWAGFMADQEWRDIKAETGAEHGQMVGSIEDHLLQPTGYSPGRIG